MSIQERLAGDVKTAMKAGEKQRVGCLRMLLAKLKDKTVERRASEGLDYVLTDAEAEQVVAAYAKQRRDSIEAFEKAGRDELAANERAELEIVNAYLPEQLGEDELCEIVRAAIAESGADSPKQMGAVMKLVMPRTKGRADGKLVNQIVRRLLDA